MTMPTPSTYYGSLAGSRSTVHRRGTRQSGMSATLASGQGGIQVRLYARDGADYAIVELVPWHGQGAQRVIWEGPVSGFMGGN